MTYVRSIDMTSSGTQSVVVNKSVVRVLYLDDDDIDRTLMQMHFKRHLRMGAVLQCVETVEQGRAAMQKTAFDYVVVDNRMPPISSYRETLDLLDLSGFKGRVIVVSSETRFECFDTNPDPRIYCVTDKADLSKAIKDGLFEPLTV